MYVGAAVDENGETVMEPDVDVGNGESARGGFEDEEDNGVVEAGWDDGGSASETKAEPASAGAAYESLKELTAHLRPQFGGVNDKFARDASIEEV